MKDDDEIGAWKDGFHMRCRLPSTLLVERRASGPWTVVENPRATKNRLFIVRTAALKWTFDDLLNDKLQVAWVGSDMMTADRLCDRFNGYEMARDFPPKPFL